MDTSSEPTTISQASPPTISSPESETKRNDSQESDHIHAEPMGKCADNDLPIDNGNSFDEQSVSNQFGGLTLVDTHPLMPRLSIDDNDASEDSPFTCSFNFPDVVPHHPTIKIDSSVTNCRAIGTIMNRAVDDDQPFQNRGAVLLVDKEYMGSSDSEPDISQYQASVEPSFQAVSLTNNISAEKSSILPKPRPMRKIALTPELMSAEDVSSVETISNNSFDDDFDDTNDIVGFDEKFSGERQMKSNTSKWSQSSGGDGGGGDGGDRNDDTGFNEISNENDDDQVDDGNAAVSRDAVTLPDGQTRDIDMKVIEPYKRVLSHGGYLKAGGHNAIVIFAGCYLPDRSRTDYNYVMENLFL